MATNPNEVYYCNLNRVQELNDRIHRRNLPSQPLETQYIGRPSRTRQVIFPMIDSRAPSQVQRIYHKPFDMEKAFNPGTNASYSGYRVDDESSLINIKMPLQNCGQNKYVPNTNSDMYNNTYLTKTSVNQQNPHYLLNKKEFFNPNNPNNCNLGYNLFNNDIRQQIKDIKF